LADVTLAVMLVRLLAETRLPTPRAVKRRVVKV
jgi:hypothetical protein